MKCDNEALLLYAVTDRHWLAGRRLNLNAIGSMDDYLWTEGMISIKGLSFGELMHKFEKSFGVKIRIDRARMPEVDYNHGKIRISDGIEHALCILQRAKLRMAQF